MTFCWWWLHCFTVINYNESMSKGITTTRLIIAIVTTSLEEVVVWVIWQFVLPEYGIFLPSGAVIAVMVVWAVFCISLFMFTTGILKKQPVSGLQSMVGSKGKAVSPLVPEGMVKIDGELWRAKSAEGKINKGDYIEVVGEDKLKLVVRKTGTPG